jgi:hypothetical protein
MPLSESDTRAKLIDPALHARGLTGIRAAAWTTGAVDFLIPEYVRLSKDKEGWAHQPTLLYLYCSNPRTVYGIVKFFALTIM